MKSSDRVGQIGHAGHKGINRNQRERIAKREILLSAWESTMFSWMNEIGTGVPQCSMLRMVASVATLRRADCEWVDLLSFLAVRDLGSRSAGASFASDSSSEPDSNLGVDRGLVPVCAPLPSSSSSDPEGTTTRVGATSPSLTTSNRCLVSGLCPMTPVINAFPAVVVECCGPCGESFTL